MATKAVGVIPARWGSTRFPGKSLAMICGKPMIRWVYERVSLAESLSAVVVATDDGRIRAAVESFGGKVAMTRPDHPSGTDRVAEAARGMAAGVIVNIQGDEPMMDPSVIDGLVGVMMKERRWDMATAAAPVAERREVDDPSVVKVVCDGDGRALYFSRSPIPFDRDGIISPGSLPYRRHLGIYAYRKGFLGRLVKCPPSRLEEIEKLEQLRALHIGGRIKVIDVTACGVGVDTPSDVPRVEAMIRRAGLAV